MLTPPYPQPRTSGERLRLLTVCLPGAGKESSSLLESAVQYSCKLATTYQLIHPNHAAASTFDYECAGLEQHQYDAVVIFGEVMCHGLNPVLASAKRLGIPVHNHTVPDSDADQVLAHRGFPRLPAEVRSP